MGQDLAEDSPAQEAPKQTKKQLILEILRFLIVGGTATVFDYAVAYLFYQWLLPPRVVGGTLSLVISTALGFCVGLIVNWILSVKFVFKDVKNKKESRSKKSFVIFTIIGVIGLGTVSYTHLAGRKPQGMKVRAIFGSDGREIEGLKDRLTGRFAAENVVNPATGEIMVGQNEFITEELAKEICDAGISEVSIRSIFTCNSLSLIHI